MSAEASQSQPGTPLEDVGGAKEGSESSEAQNGYEWLGENLHNDAFSSYIDFQDQPITPFDFGSNGYTACCNMGGEILEVMAPSELCGYISVKGAYEDSVESLLARCQSVPGGKATFGLKIVDDEHESNPGAPPGYKLGQMVQRGCLNHRWPFNRYPLKYDGVEGLDKVGTCTFFSCVRGEVVYQIMHVELAKASIKEPADPLITISVGGWLRFTCRCPGLNSRPPKPKWNPQLKRMEMTSDSLPGQMFTMELFEADAQNKLVRMNTEGLNADQCNLQTGHWEKLLKRSQRDYADMGRKKDIKIDRKNGATLVAAFSLRKLVNGKKIVSADEPTLKEFQDIAGIAPSAKTATNQIWKSMFYSEGRMSRGLWPSTLYAPRVALVARCLERVLSAHYFPLEIKVQGNKTITCGFSFCPHVPTASVSFRQLFWQVRFLIKMHQGLKKHLEELQDLQGLGRMVPEQLADYLTVIRDRILETIRFIVVSHAGTSEGDDAWWKPTNTSKSTAHTLKRPDPDDQYGRYYPAITIHYAFRYFDSETNLRESLDKQCFQSFQSTWATVVDKMKEAADNQHSTGDATNFCLHKWYHYHCMAQIMDRLRRGKTDISFTRDIMVEKSDRWHVSFQQCLSTRVSERRIYTVDDELCDRLISVAHELGIEHAKVDICEKLSRDRISTILPTTILDPGPLPPSKNSSLMRSFRSPWELHALCHHARLLHWKDLDGDHRDRFRQDCLHFLSSDASVIPSWDRGSNNSVSSWFTLEPSCVVATTMFAMLTTNHRNHHGDLEPEMCPMANGSTVPVQGNASEYDKDSTIHGSLETASTELDGGPGEEPVMIIDEIDKISNATDVSGAEDLTGNRLGEVQIGQNDASVDFLGKITQVIRKGLRAVDSQANRSTRSQEWGTQTAKILRLVPIDRRNILTLSANQVGKKAAQGLDNIKALLVTQGFQRQVPPRGDISSAAVRESLTKILEALAGLSEDVRRPERLVMAFDWMLYKPSAPYHPESFLQSPDDSPDVFSASQIRKISLRKRLDTHLKKSTEPGLSMTAMINNISPTDYCNLKDILIIDFKCPSFFAKAVDDGERFCPVITRHECKKTCAKAGVVNKTKKAEETHDPLLYSLCDSLVDQEIQYRFFLVRSWNATLVRPLVYMWHRELVDGFDDHLGDSSFFSHTIAPGCWETRITVLYWSISQRKQPSKEADKPNTDEPYPIEFPPAGFHKHTKRYSRFWGIEQESSAAIQSNSETYSRALYPEPTSVVLTTNSLGDFGKCSIISKILEDDRLQTSANACAEIFAEFASQPQTARCLVFLVLLGQTCEAVAEKYENISEVLESKVDLNERKLNSNMEWITDPMVLYRLKELLWTLQTLQIFNSTLSESLDTITEAGSEMVTLINQGPGQRHKILEQIAQTQIEDFKKQVGRLRTLCIRFQQKIDNFTRLRDGIASFTSLQDGKASISQDNHMAILAWITVLYLPMGFIAALFAIPDTQHIMPNGLGLSWFVCLILTLLLLTTSFALWLGNEIRDVLKFLAKFVFSRIWQIVLRLWEWFKKNRKEIALPRIWKMAPRLWEWFKESRGEIALPRHNEVVATPTA